MPFFIDRDATSVIACIRIFDNGDTPLEGIAWDDAGFSIDWKLPTDSAWTSITLSLGTLGSWTSGGFIEDTDQDGWYQLGMPNAAFVPGLTTQIRVKTAATDYQYGSLVAIGIVATNFAFN